MIRLDSLFGVACVLAAAYAAIAGQAGKPDHSAVPGVIIDHNPARTRQYIGCPGIAALPDGTYVASHSFFGPGSTNDRMRVFNSKDRGQTWQRIADVKGQWWSNIFLHNDALYLMGVSKLYGHVVIRRSTDGGVTWTSPTDKTSGLLLADAKYHTAPVPVVVHNGRIWRAMEDAMAPGGWGKHFRCFVMSAPADADLLDAKNWTSSNRLAFNQQWPGTGWLEGNIVVTPGGKLINLLRVALQGGDKGAIVRISDDGKSISFDPKTDFIDFPGGANKFTIRYDPKTKRYWSLVSKEKNPKAYRNILTLTSSADLRHWKVETIILRHPDRRSHAWQYVDWLFEGNDLIAVSRTAFDDGLGGARNAHNANYQTFHRVKNFRDLTMADSPPYMSIGKQVAHELPGLTLSGAGFTLEEFREGGIAFSNRKYVWREVPRQLDGLRYTRLGGGEPALIVVKAKRDITLTIATGIKHANVDITGWDEQPDVTFCYTDSGRSRLVVLHRKLKAGEEVELPQGNWTGTILLLAKQP